MNNEELVTYLKEHPTDKARLELLYMNNYGFIRKYIKRYFPCEDIGDLMQESYFAMLKAINGYDIEKGKFLTYFSWCLRTHLTRYVYSYSGLGISTNDFLNKYNRTIAGLEKLGETATIERIANKMHVSVEKVRELAELSESRKAISTDKVIGEDITLLDTVVDYNTDVESQVLGKLEKEELKKDIWECVERLPEQQANILIKHYREQEEYKEIAEDLQVSYKSLLQKKDNALQKMRRDRYTLKKLQPYIDDIRSVALQGNGVGTFKRTGMSSTERVVLKRVEYGNILEEIANL